MCNCVSLPVAIADLHYWSSRFEYRGVDEFSGYFQQLDTEGFSPEINHETSQYTCRQCGQRWYVECAPEESTWPLFALKDATGTLNRKSGLVDAHKEFLTVLAHRGFSDTQEPVRISVWNGVMK